MFSFTCWWNSDWIACQTKCWYKCLYNTSGFLGSCTYFGLPGWSILHPVIEALLVAPRFKFRLWVATLESMHCSFIFCIWDGCRLYEPQTVCSQIGALYNHNMVCTSWVFMNMGTSMRSRMNIMGNERLPYVRDANIMVSRCALICELCIVLGVYFFLEQP